MHPWMAAAAVPVVSCAGLPGVIVHCFLSSSLSVLLNCHRWNVFSFCWFISYFVAAKNNGKWCSIISQHQDTVIATVKSLAVLLGQLKVHLLQLSFAKCSMLSTAECCLHTSHSSSDSDSKLYTVYFVTWCAIIAGKRKANESSKCPPHARDLDSWKYRIVFVLQQKWKTVRVCSVY